MIANALGPVFLLIVVGAVLRRVDIPGEQYWPGIERLTYFVAFPALLIHRLALADFTDARIEWYLPVILLSLLAVSTLMWFLRNRISDGHADFTSIFQGGIRFNTYIGLAIASALFGESGLVIAAIALAIMIPLVNLLSVLCFTLGDPQQSLSPRRVLYNVFRNPLIVACIIGVLLNLSQVGLPGWTAELLAQIGAAALPLGLLAVGASLQLATAGQEWRSILYASMFKFLILPATILSLSLLAGLGQEETAILLLISCLPTASSAFILARQLGGNAPMMANIISAQSLFAFAIIPAWLWLLPSIAG